MARILLIDDETSTRQLLAAVLADAGHHVTQAADGRIGLQLLRLDDFDLVVTDVIMPGLNGLALVEALRAPRPERPIIAMTGAIAGSELFARIARDLGPHRTLAKPFKVVALLDAVDQALGLVT